ncbi:MAG: signal peptidase I, partial [Candidatus Marinimicrobia bacterium]|nr:signal peptidase I [Candidatus Neomarinimicrobiota bacterium]
MSNKQKIINEVKAIGIIVTVALLIKVTVLEAYIVPTGSMENTIMTGDFLIGSRFVYGMRTPDWIGIPYTDKGFFIPYIKFPAFKTPKKGDVLIFKYPRDKYVKYVKRCVAGPGDTLFVDAKKVFINGEEVLLSENGKFVQPILPEGYRQTEIFLHSENNRNKDYFGPIVIPKKGDVIQINENTDWRFLLPLMIMEGHSATLKSSEKV